MTIEDAIQNAISVGSDAGFGLADFAAIQPANWENVNTDAEWWATFVKASVIPGHNLEFFQYWMGCDLPRKRIGFDLPFPRSSSSPGRYSSPWPASREITIDRAVSSAVKWLASETDLNVTQVVSATFEQIALDPSDNMPNKWVVLVDCRFHAYSIAATCFVNASSGDVSIGK